MIKDLQGVKYHFYDLEIATRINNLWLALGMTLEFYTSLAKRFKLTVRKFWGLNPTFVKEKIW